LFKIDPETAIFVLNYTLATSEEGRLSEEVEKSVADTQFLDNTDDFIQSHIDSHFPPSEKVIEELANMLVFHKIEVAIFSKTRS
ncbi:MAG: hypothetical protein KGY76_09865, partial [Candidatus Thermoplasmatota archaeon]|nr:hypothetical protein [Candidatus Thermoplasmatota archaeon]